jgi:hypothetical protein
MFRIGHKESYPPVPVSQSPPTTHRVDWILARWYKAVVLPPPSTAISRALNDFPQPLQPVINTSPRQTRHHFAPHLDRSVSTRSYAFHQNLQPQQTQHPSACAESRPSAAAAESPWASAACPAGTAPNTPFTSALPQAAMLSTVVSTS